MTNLVMASFISKFWRAAPGSTQSDWNLLTIGDSMVGIYITVVPGHTGTFIELSANFVLIIIFLNVVITVLDKWCITVLNSFINCMFVKNNVAILCIDFLTDLLSEWFELGDICKVTNVDGAVRATQ